MMLESDAKFKDKVTCGLKNLANFHQITQKSQNWDFYWVLTNFDTSTRKTQNIILQWAAFDQSI